MSRNRIAFCCYGIYSDWYKNTQNIENTTLFSFDWSKNTIPSYSHLHLSCRRNEMINYSINYLLNMVKESEQSNKLQFDIIIFSSFSHVLINNITEIPNGLYQVEYFSFNKPTYYHTVLPAYEIVSDNFVRVNGGDVKYIYNLPNATRRHLFNILFRKKVFDYDSMPLQSGNSATFIPSVIHTSQQPLDYNDYRSVFSPRERFQQTLDQCKTLALVETNVYVCEGSKLDLFELKLLSNLANVVLFACDEQGFYYANVCQNKSLYEIYVMKNMITKFDINEHGYYTKFGGRYSLHNLDQFETYSKHVYKRIDNDKCIIKHIPSTLSYGSNNIIECIIYSIPSYYKHQFIKIFDEMLLLGTNSIENLLFEYIQKYNIKAEYIDMLHVIGKDAIQGFHNYC